MTPSLVAALVVGSAVGGVVSLGLAVVAWRHREVPAALPFGALMLAVAAWAFGGAAYLLTDGVGPAYLASRIVRTAAAQVPPLWVIFVLAFAGHERWVNWRTIALLWAVPTLYVFALVTAPVFELASTPESVYFLTSGGIRAPVVGKGLAYDLHLLYGLVVLAAGYVVLLSFLVRSRAVYRKQAGIVVLGSLAPVVVNAALQAGVLPHPGVDATPLAFVVAGLLFGWSLVRYDFLSVTPMAGDVLVNELPDPVFLLDDEDRVVDLNPAAATAFGVSNSHDRPIDAVHPALAADLDDGATVRLADDGRPNEDGETHFECSLTRLQDQYGTQRNTLVVLRDVTGQQRRQRRLETLQEATRQFLAASTDEEIAEIAVEYADEVLDAHGTAVFLADGDADDLTAVATSESLGDVFERGARPDDAIAGPLRRAYDEDERTVETLPDRFGGVPERALSLPLGEHGVLWIGTRSADGLPDDDENFATILARTTQVALTRVERESDLRRSRSSVERRSEQIAFFNGVLRHRLRNALLVVQGRAQHLRETVPEDERAHLDTIQQWCDDLDALSEEIREVNDTVTATESERLDAVDLSRILHAAVREFDAAHPAATVETDVDPGLRVRANQLATRVVESVLENAVLHNDRDGPHVEIRTVRAADRVQVHVADDGPGMDDEMKSIVFERDLSANQTASGFGLYFVSVLMNLYGGTVWFEDNDPRGTVAVLEFQVADEDDEASTGPDSDEPTGDGGADSTESDAMDLSGPAFDDLSDVAVDDLDAEMD